MYVLKLFLIFNRFIMSTTQTLDTDIGDDLSCFAHLTDPMYALCISISTSCFWCILIRNMELTNCSYGSFT